MKTEEIEIPISAMLPVPAISWPVILTSFEAGEEKEYDLKYYRSITSCISDKIKYKFPAMSFETDKKSVKGKGTFIVRRIA